MIGLLPLLLAPAPLELSGWLVSWNPQSIQSFTRNAAQFSEVFPEWIMVTEDGRAVRRRQLPDEYTKPLFAAARKNKIAVYGMASNYADTGFEATRMTKMLADPKKRTQHVADMLAITKADGLDGIDLDYESLPATDRENFSKFVVELGAALKKAKKKFSVTVHPKESEPGNWDGPKAQDWAAIGKAVDRFRIMCYDFSWADSGAGPIAPDDWVERVMTFAKTVVPANKLDMGIACYGYDWSKKPALSIVAGDLPKVAFEIDPRSGERRVNQMYFGGPESAKRKSILAKKLGVRGLSAWYIGSEIDGTWDAIER